MRFRSQTLEVVSIDAKNASNDDTKINSLGCCLFAIYKAELITFLTISTLSKKFFFNTYLLYH